MMLHREERRKLLEEIEKWDTRAAVSVVEKELRAQERERATGMFLSSVAAIVVLLFMAILTVSHAIFVTVK